jgi:hypothetical protein
MVVAPHQEQPSPIRTMSSAGRASVPEVIATVGPAGASCCASGAQHGDLIEAASSGCDPSFTEASLLGPPGPERPLVDGTRLDPEAGRLWDLVPRTGQVGQRLGDN